MTTDARVLACLAVDGPLTQAELARRLGLPVRLIQESVQQLRLAGEPLCSGDSGVWLARTSDELAASNRRLHARLRSQYATMRAQQHAERRMRHAEQVANLGGTAGYDYSWVYGEQADLGLSA